MEQGDLTCFIPKVKIPQYIISDNFYLVAVALNSISVSTEIPSHTLMKMMAGTSL